MRSSAIWIPIVMCSSEVPFLLSLPLTPSTSGPYNCLHMYMLLYKCIQPTLTSIHVYTSMKIQLFYMLSWKHTCGSSRLSLPMSTLSNDLSLSTTLERHIMEGGSLQTSDTSKADRWGRTFTKGTTFLTFGGYKREI